MLSQQSLKIIKQATSSSAKYLKSSKIKNGAKIIDGQQIAAELLKDTKLKIAALSEAYQVNAPKIAIVMIGDNIASKNYTDIKLKQCQKAGIGTEFINLPKNISQKEVIDIIQDLNSRSDIDSILTQLPFPKHLERLPICNAVADEKDVDCLKQITNYVNMAKQFADNNVQPCTPSAILHTLDKCEVEVKNANIAILGRGWLVGYPLSSMLLQRQANVTMLNEFSYNVEQHVKNADIVISGIGKRHAVKGAWLKKGSVVIDVGCNKGIPGVDKKKVTGDVEFNEALKRARLITPVPCGIGPITVQMVLKNIYLAWKKKLQKEQIDQSQEFFYEQNKAVSSNILPQ